MTDITRGKKEILFIVATHGDEGFSVEVLKKLDQTVTEKNYDWIIANEEALKINKRFIDCDLNRVAPGNIKSNKYEERRAAEILAISRKYKYVIDLHGTSANTGIFTIITAPTLENLQLAAILPIKRNVIWQNNRTYGPITKYVKCGVEIECGPKNSSKNINSLYWFLKNFLNSNTSNQLLPIPLREYYRVYGKLSKKLFKKALHKPNEFDSLKVKNENFFPLFVNCYQDISCLKLKRIKYTDLLIKTSYMRAM
ncbi:MAG: succinylglutamate desuccinylase/aspartoacylase family protein [Patescibacteria group bacterium]|nr:succinylglutamate desuccinylase/aspartoacylase family protein [Patescibacteria group bacterium]